MYLLYIKYFAAAITTAVLYYRGTRQTIIKVLEHT
jgi:hypothetical protein